MDKFSTLSKAWTKNSPFSFQNIEAWVTYLLVVLMPFAAFWPVGKSSILGIAPFYVAPGLHLPDIVLIPMFGLWLLRPQSRNWGPVKFWGALVSLILLAVFSIPWALNSQLAAYITLRWLIALGLYLWFSHCTIPVKNIVLMFVIGLSLQSVIGLIQVQYGPLGLPGELFGQGTLQGRALGLTFHSNIFGGYLAAAILLCIPLLRRWSMWCLWVILWSGLLVTASRSAFFGTALAGIIALIWIFYHYKSHRKLLLSAFAVIVFAIVLGDAILDHRMSKRLARVQESINSGITLAVEGRTSSDNGTAPTEWTDYVILALGGVDPFRPPLIELALTVIQHRPFTGIGAGNFPLAKQGNEHIAGSNSLMYVHNVALLLASEVGILGGGFWLLLSLSGLYFLIRDWHIRNIWSVATLCAWLAISVVSWFDSYPWSFNSGRLLTVMLLGLAARQISESVEKQHAH